MCLIRVFNHISGDNSMRGYMHCIHFPPSLQGENVAKISAMCDAFVLINLSFTLQAVYMNDIPCTKGKVWALSLLFVCLSISETHIHIQCGLLGRLPWKLGIHLSDRVRTGELSVCFQMCVSHCVSGERREDTQKSLRSDGR